MRNKLELYTIKIEKGENNLIEQKKIFFPKGRFWEDSAWSEFLKQTYFNVQNSREKTESEKRIQTIQENIDRMIVSFARRDETGDDPKSIALERIAFLEQKVQKELKEKEIACVRKELELIKILQRDREAKLASLNADKTFGSKRQSEIDEARARAEQRLESAV